MSYGTPHFPESEFRCHCQACETKEMTTEVQENLTRLTATLERLRDVLAQPIIITSGYRCVEHNKQIGGAHDSTHLKGLAADIRVSGHNGESLLALMKDLIKHGLLPDGGLGVYKAYPRIVHYDLGRPRRWYG